MLHQITGYRELTVLFDFFAKLPIISVSAEAVDFFHDSRNSGVRLGTMDLTTACIATAEDALLVTANRRDFERVPQLRFENWLE